MHTSMVIPINKLNWVLHGVGVLAAAVLLSVFGWCVFKPLADRQQLCQRRITQLNDLLGGAPEIRKENSALRAELVSLRHSVEETQRRLPHELREHEFVEQVRQAAAKAGVAFGNYHVGTVTELSSYSQAEVTVLCKGSFASICRFLDEIDHFARITEIANLQIEADDNFHSYPLQVTFVLYFGGSTHDRSRRGDVL